jgi:hypothetical protein
MSTDLPGGWSDWHFELDEAARKLFKETVPHIGVEYRALAVATQVVAGANYCFLAKAHVAYPKAPERAVLIYVFKPLPGEGEPHMTGLHDIRP